MNENNKLLNSPIIFDEFTYGKFLYENYKSEFLKPKNYTIRELSVLAKYLRCGLSMEQDEVRVNLIKFCNINYIGFDEEVKYQEINRAIELSCATNIRSCKEVVITHNEWEKINLIEDTKMKRLLFVMLAVAKFNRINPIISNFSEKDSSINFEDKRLRCYLKTKDLFKIAQVSYSNRQDYYKSFRLYIGLGLLDLIPSNRVKIVLNFGSVDIEEGDYPEVIIKDMNNIVQVFNSLNNPKDMKKCSKCGEWFKDTSVSKQVRLCSKCRKQQSQLDKKQEEVEINKYQSRKDKAQEDKVKLVTCVDCGVVFGVNYRNHKTIRCRKCQTAYKNQQRRKPVQTLQCEKCGKDFQVSGYNKRTLCEECYEIVLKEKDRNRKQ